MVRKTASMSEGPDGMFRAGFHALIRTTAKENAHPVRIGDAMARPVEMR